MTPWTALLACNIFLCSVVSADFCPSQQYLQLGKKGIINCFFEDGFYGVLWYKSKNYLTDRATIYVTQSVKKGEGFNSGEFDILANGSLIITNVTMEHSRHFTAVRLSTPSDKAVPNFVLVSVIVIPEPPYPVVQPCENEDTMCFMNWDSTAYIDCYMRNTRPVANLKWMARTVTGDKEIQFETDVQADGFLSSSRSTITNPFVYSSVLTLLTCKADFLDGNFTKEESLVIVFNTKCSPYFTDAIRKDIELHSKLHLPCNTNGMTFFVWKWKGKDDETFREILYAANDGKMIKQRMLVEFEVTNNGSLIIPNITIAHDGFYYCAYGNGVEDGMVLYLTAVYVLPSSPSPKIEGCNDGIDCVLLVEREGNLSCAVRRIRPKVNLVWVAMPETLSEELIFYDQRTTILQNEDNTFDIIVNAKYTSELAATKRHTAECKVVQKDGNYFFLASKVELIFPSFESKTTTMDQNVLWIIAPAITAPTVLLVIYGVVTVRGKRSKRIRSAPKDDDEEQPFIQMRLMETNLLKMNEETTKTELFIAELKAVYENLCVTVIPVPFSRDEMYQVNDIFVECKLDFLIQSRQPRINEEWQPLESYREILTNSQLNSNRYIIEGDSGYGKTTLAIKMVDDWKNGSEESFFGKVKIIILIRLVQIGKTHSIFKAIKQFLLPHQSKLNIEDIQSVLRCNESVIIILDGFEEYLGKNDSTDVMRIIKAEMLEHVKVILTTRQFYLPTNMPPQTKRIRLNGFDKGTRNSYIEKVFSSDDINPSGDIKQKVKENHALEDLFQIPLFFVLFTHLSHDRRNITIFGSATSFFKHIISLFHNHTRNKIRTETLSKCKSYEKEHYKLDKLAFEVLNGTRDILWEKENICDELGCGFYDHYVNTGILVEQEVYFLNGSSNFAKTSSKILVRFCQRLFYEWYAAHHLSNLAIVQGRRLDPRHGNGQSNRNRPLGHSTDAETLKNVDPFDFQYVYRFASALNPTGAKHIYQYLSSVMGGDRFTKVCQLELQENFDQVITDVETLCSDGIVITKRHSNLGQRSTIQLLETASRHGIIIRELELEDCLRTGDIHGKYMLLSSNIKIPNLATLQKLVISEEEREFGENEIISILCFCLECPKMDVLCFNFCLLPKSIHVNQFAALCSRNFDVLWDTEVSPLYRLSFESGQWERKDQGSALEDDEYSKEVDRFRKLKRYIPHTTHLLEADMEGYHQE